MRKHARYSMAVALVSGSVLFSPAAHGLLECRVETENGLFQLTSTPLFRPNVMKVKR